MKKIFIILLGVIVLGSSVALSFAQDVYVRGYYRRDGTYVRPHYRTRPDGNLWNNYSTRGNINPYTGKRGYVDPWGSSYGSRFNQRSRSLSPLGAPYGYGTRSRGLYGDLYD